MNNYKIRVNNEAESREAQVLFFELGYRSGVASNKHFPALIVAHDCRYGPESTTAIRMDHEHHKDYEELTLPQLRDLVVLHRNDVKDATHTDKGGEKIYLTSNKVIYYWYREWCKSAINKSNDYEDYLANSLKPIQRPQLEQGLISGADALRALADGEEIQWISKDFKKWNNLDEWNANLKTFLNEKYIAESEFKFRLKPRTVKLEIEVPAPFEPKVGDEFFYLNDGEECGYVRCIHDCGFDPKELNFGAWRTEADIKIVVKQIRKLKEHSK